MHIILIEPSEPGNVGAAARALKTMGLDQLVLVRPQCEVTDETAYWMAYGAQDVLQNACLLDNLHDAISGCCFVAGMTSRPRHPSRQAHLSLDAFVAAARPFADATAFVFGSERAGLANDDLAQCTHVVTIPHAVDYPSLNLSHAVMVACYEWYRQTNASGTKTGDPPATVEEVERFLAELRDADDEFVRAMRGMLCARSITTRDLRLLYQLIH